MRKGQASQLTQKTKSISQSSLTASLLMTPVESREDEEIALLKKRLNEYKLILKQKDQEIARLKKTNEVLLLFKSTPEKGEHFPATPPRFMPTTKPITPALKTELAGKEIKSRRSLSSYSEFEEKQTVGIYSSKLRSLSQPDDSEEFISSLFEKTKISTQDYEKTSLAIGAPLIRQYGIDNKDAIKKEVDGLYEPIKISFEFADRRTASSRYIVNDIEATEVFKFNKDLWPVVPMAHKWFYDSDGCDARRYHRAEEVLVDIVIFGHPDERINYLTLFNGITVQSYANTRNPTYRDTGKNNPSYADSSYQAGHCIDHAETMETAPLTYRSTFDPRNFIPEPVQWNAFRNHHVKNNIRIHKNSAYMQRIYYHRYLPFNLTSTIRTTYRRDTYIPEGVYFNSIYENDIFLSLDISWGYDFKGIIDSNLQNKCEGISCDSQYVSAVKRFTLPDSIDIPLPLYNACEDSVESFDKELIAYQTRLFYLQHEQKKIPEDVKDGHSKYLKERLERAICEKMYRAAETEYHSIQYKFCFALKCAEHGDIKTAIFYLNRVCEHINILDQFEYKKSHILISKNNFDFFKKLKTKIALDEDSRYEDLLSNVAAKT